MITRKNRYTTKFTRETIDDSINTFLSFMPDDKKPIISSWKIYTMDSETWEFDNTSNFYINYQKRIRGADIWIQYLLNGKLYKFSLEYKTGTYQETAIEISLDNKSDLENVLDIFNKDYKKVTLPGTTNIQTSNSTKLRKVITIPSCDVDKSLIKNLEDRIKQSIDDFSPEKFRIKIITSNSSQTLSSIDDYESKYFPDDTKEIEIDYSNWTKLEISINFNRDKYLSKMIILLEDKSPHGHVEGLLFELTRKIDDYKNHNNLLHPPGGFLTILYTPIVLLFILATLTRLGYLGIGIASAVLEITIVSAVIYAVFSYYKPYIVFYTKQNERINKWLNWLTFAIVEFIVFGFFITKLLQ